MSFRCTIIGLTGTSSKVYDTKCLEAGMSDVLLKPITRKILLEKLEFWTQNKAAARKTQQQLSQNKATDKQLQCSNDSPAAYSSRVASMPPQKFKAVVFGKIVFGVCTCSHDGCHSFLCKYNLFCFWECSVSEKTLVVSHSDLVRYRLE